MSGISTISDRGAYRRQIDVNKNARIERCGHFFESTLGYMCCNFCTFNLPSDVSRYF